MRLFLSLGISVTIVVKTVEESQKQAEHTGIAERSVVVIVATAVVVASARITAIAIIATARIAA